MDPITKARFSAVQVRDVTAEVESQSTLTRCNASNRCVLDAIDESVLQLDAAGRIESFNPQVPALLHRSPEELLGTPVLTALDLPDQGGRPVSGSPGNAFAPAAAEGEGPLWRSIPRGDGQRRLVRVKVAAFEGPRPGEGGTILLLKEAGTPGFGGDVPGPTPPV